MIWSGGKTIGAGGAVVQRKRLTLSRLLKKSDGVATSDGREFEEAPQRFDTAGWRLNTNQCVPADRRKSSFSSLLGDPTSPTTLGREIRAAR
jgi:hypothetical protein